MKLSLLYRGKIMGICQDHFQIAETTSYLYGSIPYISTFCHRLSGYWRSGLTANSHVMWLLTGSTP